MEREKLKSRMGFILLSAGCAIGIGNVWKFPYIAGQGGGGAFVLFYLLFLVILGLPIMTMEFAVGRASRKSPVRAYQALEKPGQKWHIHGYLTLIGCYLLMMFYTTVAGWMLHYFYMTATGKLAGLNADQVAGKFTEMLADYYGCYFGYHYFEADRYYFYYGYYHYSSVFLVVMLLQTNRCDCVLHQQK